MSTEIKKPKNADLMRKALVYAVVLDITTSALSRMGRVNTADTSKVTTIIYDKMMAQARSK